MTQPNPALVAVATNALRNEAREWDVQSATLTALRNKVAAMEFGRLEAGLFQIMVDAYNDVQQVVMARCREGAAAMTDIAGTLRSVADTYDAEDAAAMHRMTNVY